MVFSSNGSTRLPQKKSKFSIFIYKIQYQAEKERPSRLHCVCRQHNSQTPERIQSPRWKRKTVWMWIANELGKLKGTGRINYGFHWTDNSWEWYPINSARRFLIMRRSRYLYYISYTRTIYIHTHKSDLPTFAQSKEDISSSGENLFTFLSENFSRQAWQMDAHCYIGKNVGHRRTSQFWRLHCALLLGHRLAAQLRLASYHSLAVVLTVIPVVPRAGGGLYSGSFSTSVTAPKGVIEYQQYMKDAV